MKKNNELLSVGQIAERSGLAISTLHFYEQKGLIRSERNAANQRRYPRYVLRMLAVIRIAQSLGISLSEIRESLDTLPSSRPPNASDWKRLSSKWHAKLDHRIEQLTILRDQLAGCIGCGCLSVKECPLRNPDDQASKSGAGPQAFDT